MTEIKFQPISQPQWDFLASDSYEVLYGGAAFGGKSLCLVIDALRQVEHPRYLAMLFRRQYSELEELIAYAHQFYPVMGGVAREGGRDWNFPSGGKILFRQMEHTEDWRKFMGRNTTYLGFDELVSFTQEQYDGLQIWNRASAKGLKCYIRSTTNPWPDVRGDGIEWIMERWGIPRNIPVVKSLDSKEEIETPSGEVTLTKSFIPATHKDNPVGLENNPQYLAQLMRIPDIDKRKAFLDGVWGINPGAFFSTFSQVYHVLDADEMEARMNRESIRKAAGMDYGSTSPTCLIFGAQTIDGTVYIYNEYYMANKPIVFHAPRIVSLIGSETVPILGDPSMNIRGTKYSDFTDKSIKDEFKDNGVHIRDANNDRLHGYQAIKEGLYFDKELGIDDPGIYISRKCRHLISDIEAAQQDDKDPDLVAKDGQYHALAAFRYLVMHIRKPHQKKATMDLSNTPAGVLRRLRNKKSVNLYAR
tara:strand:- start:420 stop:1841 length:1422 start_codon:yes stop_codon:yes gene_type:complete